MPAAGRPSAGVPWAGLAAGPAAWAVSTQLNYALVPWACARGMASAVPALALLFVLVALGGGLLSWRAWHAAPAAPEEGGRPHHFLATIGVLSAALFALVILLQGLAGFLFSGCEW